VGNVITKGKFILKAKAEAKLSKIQHFKQVMDNPKKKVCSKKLEITFFIGLHWHEVSKGFTINVLDNVTIVQNGKFQTCTYLGVFKYP
jgi:hypothetical protein